MQQHPTSQSAKETRVLASFKHSTHQSTVSFLRMISSAGVVSLTGCLFVFQQAKKQC